MRKESKLNQGELGKIIGRSTDFISNVELENEKTSLSLEDTRNWWMACRKHVSYETQAAFILKLLEYFEIKECLTHNKC